MGIDQGLLSPIRADLVAYKRAFSVNKLFQARLDPFNVRLGLETG
jgi:hypothetical protein